MRYILQTLAAAAADKSGATAIEYGLICSLIVLVILAAVQAVATETIAMYEVIQAGMSGAS